MIPKREILSIGDMDKWKKSNAFADYTGFINQLNASAKGTKLTDQFEPSQVAYLPAFKPHLVNYLTFKK